MKTIVIFSNCAGNIIKNMFEKHFFTKDKYVIHYIINYEHLNNGLIDDTNMSLLKNCDIFIYQPLNQPYTESEYDITNIKKYLRNNTIILKINYYRFRGFWYNSDYNPYDHYNNYKFNNIKYYGIHNSFINFNTTNKNEIIDKINNIQISRDELLLFFNNEITKFKILDDNSDVNMFDYFINNYKTKQLFHDPFHPTNLFFYEIFRQIIIKLDNYELKYEDYDFIYLLNDIEMTHWALPILPIVKNILDINFGEYIYIFHAPDFAEKKLYMNIYDYYYIRLSHQNFKNYLDNLK
jgi:hypothetical protein